VIKAEFSASLLQSSVSHDPLEIILICWFAWNISYYYQLKTVCCVVLLWKLWNICLRIHWKIRSSKEQHLC